MRDETYLDKATINFKTSKILLKYMTDDSMINIVGYHLQQSTELALKYLHEVKGIKYNKTHDIDDLLKVLAVTENPITFSYLDRWRDTLTAWESKTRYVKNFLLEVRDIEAYIPLLERLLKECNDIYVEAVNNNPIEKLRKLNGSI